MSKIDSWVTKVPRLKNSKVARFSYKAEAYANDDIEGVDSYDYARDMNVPLATHTDFDADMLSIGARSNFSSVPKNGLNHFFGRVSYNLNKVIDFLSDFLDDFRVQGVETIRMDADFTLGTYDDGKKLRIANTHATNIITCVLPSGQTMNGEGTISIQAGRIIDIELLGTTWKDNLTGNLVGNVTGDLVGNVTGDLVGNVTGDLVGNVTGAVTGDVTGNVTGNADATSDSFVGMIAAFSGTADFSSWLFCDGRAVARTQYDKLFARIGITWGKGNNTTTFNLPDLREVTLVGAGDSPRVMTDPDVFTVAQFKNATFKSHLHTYDKTGTTAWDLKVPAGAFQVSTVSTTTPTTTTNTSSTGSTVTRANSMGVGYFIRCS